jgi:hypothetical protein
MAAILGTKTDGTPSAEFTPTETDSEVVISNRGTGLVILEVMAPNTEWELVTKESGSYQVKTSDPANVYRFRGVGTTIDFDYRMGP